MSKKYCTSKKDYIWDLSTCICENRRYLKSIVYNSVIVCDRIISIKESVPTNVTNAISTNVTSTYQ